MGLASDRFHANFDNKVHLYKIATNKNPKMDTAFAALGRIYL